MSRLSRIGAAVVVLAIAAPLTIGPAAGETQGEGGTVVREVVVSTLEASGKVKTTDVAQLVRLGEGDSVTVADTSEVESYRVLSGFGSPDRSGGSYEWRSGKARDAVAIAKVQKSLPLGVSATYFLDGKEVDASEVKGKSGVVRIVLKLENMTRDTRPVTFTSVSGEETTRDTLVYLPLEYSVRAAFPSDMWTDLQADDAYVQTDTRGTQTVVRPGILNPPVGPRSEEVVLQARGEKILLPRIQVFAFPRTAPIAKDALRQQLEQVGSLYGAMSSAYTTLKQVHDGAVQISAGLEKLQAGIGERDPDSKEPVITLSNGLPTTVVGAIGFMRNALRDQVLPAIGARDPQTGEPVVTLKDGTPTTVLGALGFMNDALTKQVLPAIGARDPETGEPIVTLKDGVPTTVIGALGFMEGAITGQMLPGIGARDPETGEPVITMKDGVPTTAIGALGFMENAITGQMLPGIGATDPQTGRAVTGAATLLGGIQAMKDALDAQMIPGMQGVAGDPTSGLMPAVEALSGVVDILEAAGGADPGIAQLVAAFRALIAGIQAGHTAMLGGFQQLSGGMGTMMGSLNTHDPASPGLVEGLGLVAGGMDTLTKQLHTLDPAKPGLVEGLGLVAGGLDTLARQLHTLDPAKPGLVEGLGQLSGGLDALTKNLHTLDTSKPGLVEGLGQVRDGMTALIANIHTLDPSKPGVVDGLEQIRAGLGQASTGLFAINELVIGGTRSGLLVSGDNVAVSQAVMGLQDDDLEENTFLAAGAGDSFTTYVFELAAQSTTGRDNAVRGGLIGLAALAAALFGRRPRLAA